MAKKPVTRNDVPSSDKAPLPTSSMVITPEVRLISIIAELIENPPSERFVALLFSSKSPFDSKSPETLKELLPLPGTPLSVPLKEIEPLDALSNSSRNAPLPANPPKLGVPPETAIVSNPAPAVDRCPSTWKVPPSTTMNALPPTSTLVTPAVRLTVAVTE